MGKPRRSPPPAPPSPAVLARRRAMLADHHAWLGGLIQSLPQSDGRRALELAYGTLGLTLGWLALIGSPAWRFEDLWAVREGRAPAGEIPAPVEMPPASTATPAAPTAPAPEQERLDL